VNAKAVSTWVGLVIVLGGLIYAADNRFALAGQVTVQFNYQAVVQQELFNENRLANLMAQLEDLRARQRAGYTYPDDTDTESRLIRDIERARDYEEILRQQKAQIK